MITGLYGALLAVIFILLSFNVIRLRLGNKIGLGDGNHHELQKAIRVHANFAEYVPFALLMIFLCEYTGSSIYILHAMGVTLLLARILHGWGLTKTSVNSFQRTWGVLLTFATLMMASAILVAKFLIAYI